MNFHSVLGKALIDHAQGNKKLTIRELGELSGVSERTTGRIMRGETNVKLSDVVSIATALNVEIKFQVKEG